MPFSSLSHVAAQPDAERGAAHARAMAYYALTPVSVTSAHVRTSMGKEKGVMRRWEWTFVTVMTMVMINGDDQ